MGEKRKFIPVCEPYLKGNEEKYVLDALRSGWISSSGSYIKEFEERFSAYCGMKYGVSTTSGTTALHLALLALDIKKSDEVIIPDFTMIATLTAVLYCGAKPVFVDVEADTWNINANMIEEKITERTRAILPVHIYGHPVDMEPLLKLARKYNLYIVEDAAEAHGAEYKDRKCGGIGDINCFSFFANKIITSGEGGMVVTSDPGLAERCHYYKNLCFPLSGPRDYIHNDLGYNYRMTNIQAAIGLAQLEKIEELVERRRKNAKLYSELLKDIPGVQCPVEKDYAKNVYWMYGIVINPKEFGKSRDKLMQELKEKGIDTRYFFKPMHNQKVLEKYGFLDNQRYPVAEHLSKNGLYLPSGSGLTQDEIMYICEAIEDIYKRS